MLIRPRFTEYNNVHIPQHELDFAVPFLNEDVPLYIDPFLIWKSPSLADKGLHQMIIAAFNNLGELTRNGRLDEAIEQLINASECDEVGLGNSSSRKGKRIGKNCAKDVLSLFKKIPARLLGKTKVRLEKSPSLFFSLSRFLLISINLSSCFLSIK